jgi:hypothetical protein
MRYASSSSPFYVFLRAKFYNNMRMFTRLNKTIHVLHVAFYMRPQLFLYC